MKNTSPCYFLLLLAVLPLATPSQADNFGPGNQALTGPGSTAFTLNSNTSWVDTRFTALQSGGLSSFGFASTASAGYVNNDATAYFVDIYNDDGSGGLGTLLGTSTSIQFNNTGGRGRSATFSGITLTSGANYHAVIKSGTASGVNNFTVNIAQPGSTAPKLDSFDMFTFNPGYQTRTSTNSGSTWTTIGSGGIATHSVTINGLTQGYAYTGNTSPSEPGRFFNDGTTQQFLSQRFTFDTHGGGSAGDLSSVTMGLRANTVGARDVVFRLADANNLSNIISEKTVNFNFTNNTSFFNVAPDFTGTTLLDGSAYALFVGQSNDNDSTSAAGYVFSRAASWGVGAPDNSIQTFQGNTSFAGVTPTMSSLPASGIVGTRADYGFLIQFTPVPEPSCCLLLLSAFGLIALGRRRRH